MAESVPSQQTVPDTPSTTITIVSTDTQDSEVPTLRLRLKKPKSDKKVQWTTETVDNEEMNKKKSKCCCIFKKPRKFDESSSEDSDDECEHCQGHVEKKRQPTAVVDVTNQDEENSNVDNCEQPNSNELPPLDKLM